MESCEKWDEMVSECKNAKEDFNEFSSDLAIIFADDRIHKLEAGLLLAKEMILANDLDLPKTMAVINDALNT